MRYTCLSIIFLLVELNHSFAQCADGDFESGSFTNHYTLSMGSHTAAGIDLATFTPVTLPSAGHAIVTTTDFDPWFNALQTVYQGSYSARIGVTHQGSTASMMGYSFVVTEQNKFFSFYAAMVLNYSSEHPNSSDQASVQYFMCKGTTPSLDRANLLTAPNARATVTANISRPSMWTAMYLEPGTGGTSYLMYRNWAKYCVNLSSYVGQTVSIFFIGAGCTANNHGGYWYVDQLCGNPSPVSSFTVNPLACFDSHVIADGSNSQNEDEYAWTIERVSGLNNTVVSGTTVMTTFPNSQAGIADITQLYNAGGMTFEPGLRYKITLGVRIACMDIDRGQPSPSSYINTSVFVDIPFKPEVDAGPDKFFCCSSAPASAQLGSASNDPSYQNEWSIPNGPVISNAAMPFVNPIKSTIYTVKVTTANGCIGRDEMKFVYSANFTSSITENCTFGPCAKQLGINLSFATSLDPNVPACQGDNPGFLTEKLAGFTYLWNDGQTGLNITTTPGGTFPFKAGMKNYTVTISNGCQTQTNSYLINTYYGGFAPVIYPNAFTPNGDGLNDVFYILDQGMISDPNGINAYNAYRGEFTVFNENGQKVRQQVVENCGADGIHNSAFSWDGKYNGVDQPINTYVFTLKLFNCTHPDGLQVAYGQINLIR